MRVASAVVMSLVMGACADPGREALDRVARGADGLITIAERRMSGELDGPRVNAALAAWLRTEGIEIESLSSEAARALGRDLRTILGERWRSASERLSKRLSGITNANAESP